MNSSCSGDCAMNKQEMAPKTEILITDKYMDVDVHRIHIYDNDERRGGRVEEPVAAAYYWVC